MLAQRPRPELKVIMAEWDGIVTEAGSSIIAAMGETVTYYPAGGGAGRSISAVIGYLQDDRPIQGVARVNSQVLTIAVLNSATTGITPSEWKNGDQVDLEPRQGSTARRFNLTRIIRQDAGMVTFATR